MVKRSTLILVILAFFAGSLIFSLASSLQAENVFQGSSGQKNDVFVMAGQISPKTYGLYLVDYKNKTICVYRYDSGKRNLRLMATRTYRYDVKLDSFNVGEPGPLEVKDLIETQKRLDELSKMPKNNETSKENSKPLKRDK